MTERIHFEFVETPPDKPKTGWWVTNDLYRRFAEALRDRPGEWAVWPHEQYSTGRYAAAVANNIRKGKYSALPMGEFEVYAAEKRVYVRFIGDVRRQEARHDDQR